MTTWALAPSLAACRREANEIAPNRSKASDGTIGDAAHLERDSDHNPGARNLVHALDLTHDPAGGWDAHYRAERLRVARDPRISYIISRGRIAGPGSRARGWDWHPYTGKNRHDRHVHLSILSTPAAEVDTRQWWRTDAAYPHTPSHWGTMAVGTYPHPKEHAVTLDELVQLDQAGNAQWFTDYAWTRFMSAEACHPTRPYVTNAAGVPEGYSPGLAAQPVEDDGKIVVVVTGGKFGGEARVMLTVSEP